MCGVGNKAPLPIKGGFQARKKPVNGIPEILEFVGWSWQSKAFVQVLLRDLPGGGCHDLEWSEHATGDDPAKHDGHDRYDGKGDPRLDQKLAQVGYCLSMEQLGKRLAATCAARGAYWNRARASDSPRYQNVRQGEQAGV
jgi:hypothetical protein